MNQNNFIYIDPEDPEILLGEFDFNNDYFNLEEPDISHFSSSAAPPFSKIKNKFQPYKHHFKFGHINARSIPKSIDELNYMVSVADLDALAVSESWLQKNLPGILFEIKGYKIFRKDRTSKRGGGVCFYCKQHLNPKLIKIPHTLEQPEVLFIEMQGLNSKIALGVVYKAPKIPYGTVATLHEALADVLCHYDNTFVFGDFNIDMLDTESCAAKFFTNNIIEPFDFKQVVTEPTRVTDTSAKLLDLILVSNPNCVKMVGTADLPGISDHSMVFLACSIKKPKYKPKTILIRDYSKFNYDSFRSDASQALWENVYAEDTLSVEDKVTIFNNITHQLFDKHAPYKQITFSKFGRKPKWLTEDITVLQAKRDQAHFEWKKDTKNTKLKNTYKTLKNICNQKIRNSKIKVFNDEINTKVKNTKQFWSAAGSLGIHKAQVNNNFCKIDPTALNQQFVSNNNATGNKDAINDEIHNILNREPTVRNSFQFQQVEESVVKSLVKSLKYTSGGHDDITAKMIKLVIPFAITALTNIVNSSLVSGIFPEQWKKAIVIPVPKIPDPNAPGDYRPISLLATLSKILEKIVSKQILKFLQDNNLMESLQSGFRPGHSTATALLKVTDDIFSAIDSSEVSFLILLDYSKAFDTFNHKLLLAKLLSMGFRGTTLDWIGSYLAGRAQKVKSNGQFSDWSSINNGVPQGSILGPLLFTILVSDFKNSLNYTTFHQYADDVQVKKNSKVNNVHNTIKDINSELKNISNYSVSNGLRLNYSKSKYMILGTSQNINKINNLNLPPVILDDHILQREKHLKNLGVIFDENMSWVKHVNKIVCNAYNSLRTLYRFKRFLSENAKKSLCESLVLSHFNYCDCLFPSLTKSLVDKIQKVQNACVRFIYNLRKYDRDHISPFLKKLGWMNMFNRRLLHSYTLMFKIDKNLAPQYLADLVPRSRNIHNHNTRSANNFRSCKCNLATKQNSFFPKIPSLYNKLPLNIKNVSTVHNFKKQCKAHILSKQAS